VSDGEKISGREKPSTGTLAEPRIACPRCGAHLLVVASKGEELSVVCPVCQFRGRAGHDTAIEPID